VEADFPAENKMLETPFTTLAVRPDGEATERRKCWSRKPGV
jgi:hypothetical protein